MLVSVCNGDLQTRGDKGMGIADLTNSYTISPVAMHSLAPSKYVKYSSLFSFLYFLVALHIIN